jgi:hypothetical protein
MVKVPAYLVIDRIIEVAKALSSLDLHRSDMYDTHYFPPRDAYGDSVLNYFLAMVAIDHRTHLGNHTFSRKIGDETYTGSDLLWRLGMEMYNKDPEFFNPLRLSKLDPIIVKDWLTSDYGPIWDYGVRAHLLRDVGIKVISRFGTASRLFSGDNVEEIINRLSTMAAYEDPVSKKAYLLLKFLTSRGLIKIKPNNLKLPIDNHLTRIAYRLGIVRLEDWVQETIKHGLHVDRDLDIRLRLTVRDAWDAVIRIGKIDPIALDDNLWKLGRTTCIMNEPKCDQCPLRNVCQAYSRGVFINEHIHYITYYY